jgi:hypothetical protein
MMKKILLPFIAIMFLVGCATETIVYEQSTGLPARNYEIYLTSPSRSEIKTIFHIVRTVEKSQESTVPEYLDLYREYKLPEKDTKGLHMVIRVWNPKKDKYKVVKVIEQRPEFEWDFNRKVTEIYNGSDEDKSFQLVCPTQKGNYRVSAAIIGSDGLPIAMYPEFKYVIK